MHVLQGHTALQVDMEQHVQQGHTALQLDMEEHAGATARSYVG